MAKLNEHLSSMMKFSEVYDVQADLDWKAQMFRHLISAQKGLPILHSFVN
jgi:hypothetical protein